MVSSAELRSRTRARDVGGRCGRAKSRPGWQKEMMRSTEMIVADLSVLSGEYSEGGVEEEKRLWRWRRRW